MKIEESNVRKQRRLRILYVSPEMLISLFHVEGQRFEIANAPLPPDAESRGVIHDVRLNSFGIVIWSASYSIVPEVEDLPIIPDACIIRKL